MDDPPARRYPLRERHPPDGLSLATLPLDLPALPATACDTPEPTFYREVVQIPEWQAAMTAELEALERTSTWELVPPTRRRSYYLQVGLQGQDSLRWLCEEVKARLVARGFQ